jgi:hypothetical protein
MAKADPKVNARAAAAVRAPLAGRGAGGDPPDKAVLFYDRSAKSQSRISIAEEKDKAQYRRYVVGSKSRTSFF